jgi:hypothetical protein
MKTDDNKIQHVNQVTTNMRNTWPNMAAKDTPQDIAKKKTLQKKERQIITAIQTKHLKGQIYIGNLNIWSLNGFKTVGCL